MKRVGAVGAAVGFMALALGAPGVAHAQSAPEATTEALPPVAIVATAPPSCALGVKPPNNHALLVAGWTLAGSSVAVLSVGVVFAVLAANESAQFESFAHETDPMSGLPLIPYSDIRSVDDAQRINTDLSVAMFGLGGALAVASTVTFIAAAVRGAHPRPAYALRPVRAGMGLTIAF